MDKTIYYYRTASNTFHFSTGAVKKEAKAGEYLRMLHYAKYETIQLFLSNEEDFIVICNLFNIRNAKNWEDVYYERI